MTHTTNVTARVLATLSQKGGTGKTTLSCGLAAVAQARGLQTVLLDTDPQHSATRWAELREARGIPKANLHIASCSPTEAGALINGLQGNGAQLIILDTAPATNDAARLNAALADTILIPIRPSLPDIAAITNTLRIAERTDTPTRVVINQAIVRHPHVAKTQTISSKTWSDSRRSSCTAGRSTRRRSSRDGPRRKPAARPRPRPNSWRSTTG